MGCFYAGMSRGMNWGTFILIFAAMFAYMMWAVLYSEPEQNELSIPREVAERAPVEAIAAMMSDFESRGYTVGQTKDLEQDPGNVQRVFIEYVLTNPDGSESWVYTWAWEVPVALTSGLVNENIGAERYERLYEQCRLIPISEAAIESQAILDEYIASESE